ncbi:MAG TPA: hypothetical protein VF172_13925 [Nitrososphaera sp.]|jgi:hypothetical protein
MNEYDLAVLRVLLKAPVPPVKITEGVADQIMPSAEVSFREAARI